MLPWVAMTGRKFVKLVSLFILKPPGKTIWQRKHRLYRDDGLAIIKNKSAHLAHKIRKELYKAFKQFDLKITARQNLITRGKL